MNDRIKLRDGDTMLIMVKDGAVIHFTPNMGLPHSEFVKRATGDLPQGAWVGTVSKLDGEIAAITSKYFFGYQLPAPEDVRQAVCSKFEWAHQKGSHPWIALLTKFGLETTWMRETAQPRKKSEYDRFYALMDVWRMRKRRSSAERVETVQLVDEAGNPPEKFYEMSDCFAI